MAKIVVAEENLLQFDNGVQITADHDQDCCEWNYADFAQLDSLARAYNFNTSKLRFEKTDDGSGFRFGDCAERMFFVPCYSEQNGYYSNDLQVYLMGISEPVLDLDDIPINYC